MSAIAVSLAIAMIASAGAGLSAAELRTARAGLAKVQAEAALDNAQKAAWIAVLESGQTDRLRWSLATDDGPVDALAEPETAKADYAHAARLTDAQFARLGVRDPAALRDRLKAQSAAAGAMPTRDLDASPLWRTCAPSLTSRFGLEASLALSAPQAPASGRFGWRAGDVWRVRVASGDGWSDDRVIRFTGDATHPAAIIERTLSREGTADRQCDTLFARG